MENYRNLMNANFNSLENLFEEIESLFTDLRVNSKVVLTLKDVSIENESDWLQMARFHAEWSKKFYDIIVPYLL